MTETNTATATATTESEMQMFKVTFTIAPRATKMEFVVLANHGEEALDIARTYYLIGNRPSTLRTRSLPAASATVEPVNELCVRTR